jgi:hypothetical protein
MEELKHETDPAAAQLGKSILVEGRDVHVVDEHVAVTRRIETGDETEQRGFAAPGWSRNRGHLPRRNNQIEWMQDDERAVATRHAFGHSAQFDHDVGI